MRYLRKPLFKLTHHCQEAALHQEQDPPAPLRLLLPARRDAAGEGRGDRQRHRRVRPLRHHGGDDRPAPGRREEERAVRADHEARREQHG